MTDKELLEEIKTKAKNCKSVDEACALVYFINNITNSDGFWRNWTCEKHHYSGSGSENKCPECSKLKECEHHWVLDGHNAGEPICSKCLRR